MKKIGKVLFGIIVIGMLITIAYYLFSNVIDNPFVKNNALQTDNKNQDVSDAKKVSEEQLPVSANGAGILPYDKNTRGIKESFALLNGVDDSKLQCCVNDVSITKDAIDTDAAYYAEIDNNNPVQFNADYNILNDFVYVSVNVTIVNEGDTKEEIYINNFRMVAIDPETEDSGEIYYNGELRGYKTRSDELDYNKSYAKKELLPAEEFTSNLVFIQRESDVNNYIPYVKYSGSGVTNPEYDKECIYVRLKE